MGSIRIKYTRSKNFDYIRFKNIQTYTPYEICKYFYRLSNVIHFILLSTWLNKPYKCTFGERWYQQRYFLFVYKGASSSYFVFATTLQSCYLIRKNWQHSDFPWCSFELLTFQGKLNFTLSKHWNNNLELTADCSVRVIPWSFVQRTVSKQRLELRRSFCCNNHCSKAKVQYMQKRLMLVRKVYRRLYRLWMLRIEE
jgi:hypothetical protein